MKIKIQRRFNKNIARVKNLVDIYRNQLSGSGRGRRGHQETDVLRAATVLLHASLEDVLRSLAYWKLPTATGTILENIPLVGTSTQKFNLGSLVAHRGKTIDDVIAASVDASLERSNYNNATEIASLLQSLGANTTSLEAYMPMLGQTMQRRHQIVHRADANPNPNPGRGNHRVATISPATLEAWIKNTEHFVNNVLAQF